MSPSIYRNALQCARNVFPVIAVMAVIEWSRGWLYLSAGPAAILVPITLFVAMKSGKRAGFVSAALSWTYLLHLSVTSSAPLDMSVAYRLVLWFFSLPLSVLFIVRLRDQLFRFLDRQNRLLNLAPVGIFEMNAAGECVYFSGRCRELTGYEFSEIAGMQWSQFIDERDRVDVVNRWRQAVEANTAFLSEHRFVKKDGSVIWIRTEVEPFSEKNRLRSFAGVFQDITSEKLNRIELEQHEVDLSKRLEERDLEIRTIVNSLPQLVWTADRDGNVDYYNHRWKELIDFDPLDPELNARWSECFHPEDASMVISSWLRAVKLGMPYELEYRMQSFRTGEYRWFLGRALPVRNEQGDILKWFGTATDVNEQKRLAEAALESDRRTQFVLQHAQVLLWATDRSGCYTYYEGRLPESVSPFDRKGLYFHELHRERPALLAGFQRALAGESCRVEEKKDAHWYEVSLSPSYDRNGQVSGVVGVSVNVTERKNFESERARLMAREQAAQEADRLKSEFIANVSHEIRTPLNGVIGMTGLLLDTPLNSEQREQVATLRQSGEQLLGLIGDILDFSKLDANRLEVESMAFDFETLVRDSVRAYQALAIGKKISIRQTYSSYGPQRHVGDGGRIRQVLGNLLSNAIKFTLDGEVHIDLKIEPSARVGQSHIRVSVFDTGIGIDEEVASRLFVPFSQGDASISRRFGGTGLGLSISKKLIQKMGGNIGVDTDRERGACFWFSLTLPTAPDAWDEAKEPKSSYIPIPGENRILVVEDNLVNQKVARKQLESLGYRVEVAANGIEAIAAVESFPYDLVLMDCQMPEMDGLEAARRIRKSRDPAVAKIPIVAMTANALAEDRAKCLESGMNDYISKPVEIHAIERILSRWLRFKEQSGLIEERSMVLPREAEIRGQLQ